MALVNTAKIEEYTGMRSKAAEKAAKYVSDAVRSLKSILSIDVYDAIAAKPAEDDDRVALERAEAFLALYHSLPILNMRPADSGGLLKMVGHGDYQEELMSHYNLEATRSAIWDFALDIVDHLVPDPEDDSLYKGHGFGLTAVPKNENTDATYRNDLLL